MGLKAIRNVLLVMAAILVLVYGNSQSPDTTKPNEDSPGKATGSAQLVSVEPLVETDGPMCAWESVSATGQNLSMSRQSFLRQTSQSRQKHPASVFLDKPPERTIHDSYPTYSAVAVDDHSNEVYLQDENLTGYNVFGRLDNTPPTATMTEPKRTVSGPKTKMDYNCGLYIDPQSGDVYTVDNDIVNTLTIFPRTAKGNVAPMREIHIPHRGFSIAVDEGAQELFLTVQHPPAVVVYRKMAKGNEAPLRILEGPHTMLADPHGVALDTKDQLMFVSNYGAESFTKGGRFYSRFLPRRASGKGNAQGGFPTWHVPGTLSERGQFVPGSGRYHPPSIAVYSLKASGDTAPLRVIQGAKTQMDWPATLSIDPDRGELFVANDMGNSILVFPMNASGNAAPKRVLEGPKTAIHNPTGVFADVKNQELWVSNMGNHSATVYPLAASGNVPPLRTIRSSPANKPALMIGNPGAIDFDSKREQVLVPN